MPHTLAATQTYDRNPDADRPEPTNASQPNAGGDELQLIERALLSLHDLYNSNLQLTEDLQRSMDEVAAATAEVEKWQTLATTAVSKAREADSQRARLESRAQAAEQEAEDARRELADYKSRFSGTVDRLRQANDAIASSYGKTVHAGNTHFRVVRSASGM